MDWTLALIFCDSSVQFMLPASGPISNPRGLADGNTLNSCHTGMFLFIHSRIFWGTFSENLRRGTITHLGGLSLDPASLRASANIGAYIHRYPPAPCGPSGCEGYVCSL